MREGPDEGDHAFAFLDFYFRIFDGANLLVHEAVEQAQHSVVELVQSAGDELLVGILDFGLLLLDRAEDTNALSVKENLASRR